MNLTFGVKALWSGVGRDGEGSLALGEESLTYSAPASMGGKGTGTSPEELLLAAVTACYSGTLMRVLQRERLPAASLRVETSGLVEQYPEAARFARITVNPAIVGGDVEREGEYRAAAIQARDRCFIGSTVRDSLEYVVGAVSVLKGLEYWLSNPETKSKIRELLNVRAWLSEFGGIRLV